MVATRSCRFASGHADDATHTSTRLVPDHDDRSRSRHHSGCVADDGVAGLVGQQAPDFMQDQTLNASSSPQPTTRTTTGSRTPNPITAVMERTPTPSVANNRAADSGRTGGSSGEIVMQWTLVSTKILRHRSIAV